MDFTPIYTRPHPSQWNTNAKYFIRLFAILYHRYLKPGKSGMTIMDIGIFTGFEADTESLEQVMH